MLSNRAVVCLSIGIILVGFLYNHCTLDCLLKTLSCVPFVGNYLGLELKPRAAPAQPPNTVTPTVNGDDAPPRRTDYEKSSESVADRQRLFTAEELSAYDGKNGLHLAVLGLVYDVEKGSQYYAKGQSYHHFAGRDASRAFVTGDFADSGLRDDVLDLKPEELLGLQKWTEIYAKDYPVVGKMIGRYYDETGQPTGYLKEVQKATEGAHNLEKAREERKKLLPPCNSEWLQESGGRVWCTTSSGGIEREWAGVPRHLFEPETGKTRCACVRESDLGNPNLKEFANCPKNSESCTTE